MSRLLRLPAIPTAADGLSDDGFASTEAQDDDASVSPSISELVAVSLFVVYSPTYHVPALYFTAHQNSV